MIKPNQRDVLIAHIDGPVPLVVRDSPRLSTTRALARLGWLRYEDQPHPRVTLITDEGRMALARALADWADASSKIAGRIDDLIAAARRQVSGTPDAPRPYDRIRPARQRRPKVGAK